jgi:hypothetical protein
MRRRLDRYDFIGIALAVFVVALFTAHFVLPAGPPPTELTN